MIHKKYLRISSGVFHCGLGFLLFLLLIPYGAPTGFPDRPDDGRPGGSGVVPVRAGRSTQDTHTIPPQVGQWLLYEVRLKNSGTNETASFTMKISLVGKETIDNQICFWEELDLPTLGVVLKRLSNLATGQVKKCIFQRRGDQPVEFDITELSRQLGKSEDLPAQAKRRVGRLAKLVTAPSLSFFPEVIEPTYQVVSRKKTSYSLPRSRKRLTEVEQTDYEDLAQTLRLSIWTSVDIPITHIIKSIVVSKELSTSIILLDFGLTGASSRITGLPVPFGTADR